MGLQRKKRINIHENKDGDKNGSKASERGNEEELSHQNVST